MVGSGDRSEKIRTYNFPQNRVTDHRIGLTLHQLNLTMVIDVENFIRAVDALTTYSNQKISNKQGRNGR